MKLLLNQAHIDEKSWYDIILAHSLPKDTPKNRVVFQGTLEGMHLFSEKKSSLLPKNTSVISSICANDGSHITNVLLNKDSTPSWQRVYKQTSYPICYRDYLEKDSFPFKDDPISSFESAWKKVGSPLKFVVYLELIQRPNPNL